MRNLVVILLSATALCGASAASATVALSFGTPSGALGIDQSYSTSVGKVVASGYGSDNSDANLFGKNLGGDETGLGLVSDPQHEIYFDAYIQLNVSHILNNVTAASFFMGSTTNGEGWAVYGSNTDACNSTLCRTLLTSDNTELTWNSLANWGKYDFYDFVSTGTNGNAPGNVLLGGLALTPSVPEPSTWAMMLLGFGAIGVAVRRRRKQRPNSILQLA